MRLVNSSTWGYVEQFRLLDQKCPLCGVVCTTVLAEDDNGELYYRFPSHLNGLEETCRIEESHYENLEIATA